MNIKIDFFLENFIDAIGAGVYEIYIKYQDNTELLYVGESENVLKRCGEHLYKLKNHDEYLGLTKKELANENIKLIFNLSDSISEKLERVQNQINKIKTRQPLSQSGRSDYLKEESKRIEAVKEFLNNRDIVEFQRF